MRIGDHPLSSPLDQAYQWCVIPRCVQGQGTYQWDLGVVDPEIGDHPLSSPLYQAYQWCVIPGRVQGQVTCQWDLGVVDPRELMWGV